MYAHRDRRVSIKVREELAIRAQASEVRTLIAAGKYDEARAPLEKLAEGQAPVGRGLLPARPRDVLGLLFDQGFAALERARELGHPRAEIERQRGIILARLGRHQEAEPLLRRVFLSAAGPDPEADEALAKCYMETFRLGEAELRDRPMDAATPPIR